MTIARSSVRRERADVGLACCVLLPVLMLVVTVIASLLPAARATRVDPMVALRYE